MCCDVDFDKEGISPSGLFLAFTGKHPDFIAYHLMTGTAIAPTKDGIIDAVFIDMNSAIGFYLILNIVVCVYRRIPYMLV